MPRLWPALAGYVARATASRRLWYSTVSRIPAPPGALLRVSIPADCKPLNVVINTTSPLDADAGGAESATFDVPDGCAVERDGGDVVVTRQGDHGTAKEINITIPERYVGVHLATHAGSVIFKGSIKEAAVSVVAPSGSIVAQKGTSIQGSSVVLAAGELPGIDFSAGTLAATPLRLEATSGGSVFVKKVVSGDAIVGATKGPGTVHINTMFAHTAVVATDSGTLTIKAGRYGASLAGGVDGGPLRTEGEEGGGGDGEGGGGGKGDKMFEGSVREFAVPSAKSADAYAAHKWEAYSLRGSPPPLDAEGGLLAISKGGGIHVDGIEGAAAAVRAGSPGLLGFAFPSFRRTDVRVSATTECTRLTAMNRGDGEVYLSIPPPADLEEDAGGNHSRAGRGVPVESAVSEWKLRIVAARGVRYTSENVANALNWCGAPHAPLTSLPYGPRWVAQRQSVRKDTTYKVSGSSNDVELKVEAERGTLIIGEHTWKPNWSA
ncbi:Adhesin domain-containing protein [Pseudoscourfieldia marina]